ncbi:hypothetical protein EPI10_009174 [Gossypium australe]|uniref:Uncharacterized protein n=1 Tax=Gossypium australe TaxID=47621 RepID=A0A5B6UAD1_9ROSI|nr:hypothetical protein EPI10_009174 [Gossypium australe]
MGLKIISKKFLNRPFSCQYPPILSVHHRDIRAFAGRSKKKPGGQSSSRLEGNAEIRRVARQNTRRKQKKRAKSLFYWLKNPGKSIHADNFNEEELEAIGLGYDRMYGEFGPYSWRGVVVAEPIRGWYPDERVTMIGEVKNHKEWEKIEQFETASKFGKTPEMMDRNAGFRYCWVFVRHPKWRITELPWEQWTLVSEVVLEAKKTDRLDKWSLMGRLGNKARSLITQCAARMRPDIIYVKKPVYQCRFEGQDEFFNALIPFLDPKTERDFLFGAFVDDVVKRFEKLSEEGKSRCLGFLLGNHPLPLLHPYTKERKAKLEEMELEFQKALSSSDKMEKLVKRSVEVATEFYNK